MESLEQAEHDIYFRTNHINVLKRISTYFKQYELKEGLVKVTIIATPTDNSKELVICYVQFNPKEIDIENKLHKASYEVCDMDNQLFMGIISDKDDVENKINQIYDYLKGVIS